MSLLTSRALPLGAKGRLHFACVGSIMLYGSVGWAVEEEDVIRLERNNVRMIRGYALLGLRIGLLKMNLELNQN